MFLADRGVIMAPAALMILLHSLLIISLWLGSANIWAADVKNVRIWPAPDSTRVVLDISAPVTYEVIHLPNPERLVIDLPASRLQAALSKLEFKGSPIANIRSSQRPDNKLRLVLDLQHKINAKVFALAPNQSYGNRLVIDLNNYQIEGAKVSSAPKQQVIKSLNVLNSQRDIVIAIDAGHGGDDPGALGPRFGGKKLREKHVVLAIAKYLRQEMNSMPGFEGVLLRSGDYYISLRGRTKKARQASADLFVSVHADAFKNSKARGASVWTLSKRGASSELGRWLAQKENSADLIGGIGGVSLDDKEEDLAKTLLDLSMTHSQSTSRGIALSVHRHLSRMAHMHKDHVERAGFAVLKSPDIPSILVETGFISNPQEAAKLRTPSYQQQMAKAIATGIREYFYANPVANTYIATLVAAKRKQITYKVVKGDTLSEIAQRYNTSIGKLRAANAMDTRSVLQIGQQLVIPTG
jgi:N-acetylmuramoyl-L-alanine amidase